MPSQTIICCICSREKNESPNLLPARRRYTGSHIGIAEKAAAAETLPLYILSGMLGLVGADEPVPHYDHYLNEKEVPHIANLLVRQLQQLDIGTVHFYVKLKPTWGTYLRALQMAAEKAGTEILIRELPDDA